MQPIIVGIDEVGRGPLAGPVISAAVILNNFTDIECLKDSKSIPKPHIIKIAEKIRQQCYWGIGIATVEEIEQLNILQATMLCMKRAVINLNKPYDIILVDGNQNPFPQQDNVQTIIKGDQSDINIAAASILAKAYRDLLMTDLHKEFPIYNWKQNSGYGTLEHRNAIKQYSITPHHRKLFLRKICC